MSACKRAHVLVFLERIGMGMGTKMGIGYMYVYGNGCRYGYEGMIK